MNRIACRLAGLLLAFAGHATAQVAPADAPQATAETAAVADDGPYVFHAQDAQLESLWLCNGEVVRLLQPRGDAIPVRCGFQHPLLVPDADIEPVPLLPAGTRIVALSDIHGQYDLMVRLLRAHQVIDQDDDWNLGRDHLVLTGDVFDRGPKVTETFWLLFRLQQQAQAAGGAVHFLLGNHETMVLYEDLRYVHPRYLEVARRLGRSYPALYGADSVLGGWLRTRPVLLKLGDTLFLHGGIAPENLDLALDRDATNAAYQASLGTPRDAVKADPATARLYDGKRSPIWYRGYFNGELSATEVHELTERLGVARIVVGHTSMEEVGSFHDGRIIAIDSSIKNGESGELLFIEDGRLSRGLLDGSRQPLREQLKEQD